MKAYGVKHYFEEYGTKIVVKKETSICNPKLSDQYIYYLAEGIASLTSLRPNGEETDFLYFPHDHLLGFAPALVRHYRRLRGEVVSPADQDQSSEPTVFGIDTKTDCVFYRLTEHNFDLLLESDPLFLSYIMEAVTRNYTALVLKFHDSQENNPRIRLYKWFLTFSEPENDYRAVPHGFTYTEIAKYLNIHPVTVSKIASELKKNGIIRKENGRILIIDEQRLREML